MAQINQKFASALKARLNGQASSLPAAPEGAFGLAHARQAKVDGDCVSAAAAEALGIERLESLKDRPVSQEFLSSVPISFARTHSLIGLADGEGPLPVAISDLSQLAQVQVLSKILNRPVMPLIAPRQEIHQTINAAYQQQGDRAQQVIQQLSAAAPADAETSSRSANEDLLDVSDRADVIKLVRGMIFDAVKGRASDVHIEPQEDRLAVRFRIDGVMNKPFFPPRALQEEIVSRIKVMGGMNIAERRLAQDGRATVQVGDRVVDLRIATLPTCFGERAVIRLLDKSARLYKLPDLGMPPDVLGSFRRLIRQDHGIILVTGPTGSGKSTTLYAALQEINAREFNIITLEDPIEYRLPGISQTQVSDRKGMTFDSGLRHVLRQDPDIIMVGEIRDAETAHMAIQSALTGHLVFSTLHTNDASGAVARMLDLGVEPYLLASSLLGVLAQRLVRRVCDHCRTAYEPTDDDLLRWGMIREELPTTTLYRGVGCEACMSTGFRERVGVFELLVVNEAIRDLIHSRAKASSIKAQASGDGMISLRKAGIAMAVEGGTTLDEVVHVAGLEDR